MHVDMLAPLLSHQEKIRPQLDIQGLVGRSQLWISLMSGSPTSCPNPLRDRCPNPSPNLCLHCTCNKVHCGVPGQTPKNPTESHAHQCGPPSHENAGRPHGESGIATAACPQGHKPARKCLIHFCNLGNWGLHLPTAVVVHASGDQCTISSLAPSSCLLLTKHSSSN